MARQYMVVPRFGRLRPHVWVDNPPANVQVVDEDEFRKLCPESSGRWMLQHGRDVSEPEPEPEPVVADDPPPKRRGRPPKLKSDEIL